MRKLLPSNKKLIYSLCKSCFWFSTGAFLGLFLLVSFIFILFQRVYRNTIYSGITVNNVSFEGKAQEDVKKYFELKNQKIADTHFVFSYNTDIYTISAKDIDYGYNAELLASQAYSIGRSKQIFSDISLVFQGYLNGVNLPASYTYSQEKLEQILTPTIKKAYRAPDDALFSFEKGKVTAFRPSSDGQEVDIEALTSELTSRFIQITLSEVPQTISIKIPIKILHPKVTTEKVNNLGIKELIGTGTSLFQGSIPNRIHNVTLAATRMNSILIEPNETFSFNKALGDISAFTGYKQAYVIQNGKTVLGDGGGVCQVSTTLFRAALNAGLPILERHAHAYRVHYYEEDSPPGIDATVYGPSIDFRFKNDTGHYILIQSVIDPIYQRLTFFLYGTLDGRKVTLSQPIITSQSPAPDPLYQDDPTLPKGTEKQIDFAAAGAVVQFSREVVKDGKSIISERFISNYRPWQAIFLKGTQE